MTRFDFTPIRSLGLVAAISTVALAGCDTVDVGKYFDFAKVDFAAPGGNAFQNALYADYRKLTHLEASQTDFVDANRYGAKALMSAAGKEVQPDDLSMRKLNAQETAMFGAAHGRLITVFGRGATDRFPKESAMAQTRYDCWVEQQEENIQPEHIAACRRGFERTIAKLEESTKPAPKPVILAAPKPAPAPLPGPYTVSFRPDRDVLSADTTALIEKAVVDFRKGGASRLALDAHADRMGDETYNDQLSIRRANAVVEMLVAGGVPEKAIDIATYGERKPKVPTDDGVAEQRNRVVVISFVR